MTQIAAETLQNLWWQEESSVWAVPHQEPGHRKLCE